MAEPGFNFLFDLLNPLGPAVRAASLLATPKQKTTADLVSESLTGKNVHDARMDTIKAQARNAVKAGTLYNGVLSGGNEQINTVANGMRAGIKQGLFGLPDYADALVLALKPDSPTKGSFADSLELAHAITDAQAEKAPVSSLLESLPVALATGNELTKGANLVATGLADTAKAAPKAVQTAANVLKAATEFRPATGAGKEANFIARALGNAGSGIAQGTALGALNAAGTGHDVGQGALWGGLLGNAGALAGDLGGLAWRISPFGRTATAEEAIQRLVQEDPAALAQRYRQMADNAGQADIPLVAALDKGDARRVFEHALDVRPETRMATSQGAQRYQEAQPANVATEINRASDQAPRPRSSEAGFDFVNDPGVTGPKISGQYMKDARDVQMRAALAPHEATLLDMSGLKNLSSPAQDELRLMIRKNKGIDNRPGYDPLNTPLTMTDAESLRQTAGGYADRALKAGNISESRLYEDIANTLKSSLADQIPEYAPAFARWKAQTDVIDGYEHGLAGKPIDENLSKLDAANLKTQEGQYGYRLGMTQRMRQGVRDPKAAIQFAKETGRAPAGAEFGGSNLPEDLYGANADTLRSRLKGQTAVTQGLEESTRVQSPLAQDKPRESHADNAAFAHSLAGHLSPWAVARLATSRFFTSQGISSKAAQKLTEAVLDPNSSDRLLQALAKEHPNLGLTSKALRQIGNQVAASVEFNRDTRRDAAAQPPSEPATTAPAPAAEEGPNPYDQFDAPQAPETSAPSGDVNPYDQFDTAAPEAATLEPAAYTIPDVMYEDPGAGQRYADFLSQFGTVSSIKRSPAHNKRVGGVSNSMHLTGQAVDFVPTKGIDRRALVAALKQAGPFTEVLDEGDHIHVGWRKKGMRRGKAA